MKIALDYDETFTADPELWKMFISACEYRGHSVKFVTYRPDRNDGYNDDILLDAESLKIDVIFTGGKQKENFWDADVWIDDSPETIPCAKKLGDMYDGCLINNDMEG
ncbi:MAG: hypothetical protein GOVbin4162_64 [Prokaryotic dsDNA virus sp.]|nr:MAG: hypothetical protein GOVbin4162_64 [Prokaryotic dsDNA virus sp.]|tara:strand:+ start:3285 stop:3605 length:321 start_codon:yes stop_codon:yes gene_type:complete